FQTADHAKVADLDVLANQEQVTRLDIKVEQAVLLIEQVEGLGCLAEVGQQFRTRDAWLSRRLVLAEHVEKAAVGQLGDDKQLAVADLDPFEGENKWMANVLDTLKGLQLLLGGTSFAESVEAAVDEFDRLGDTAGSGAFPDFAETARAEWFDEPVTGDRFSARLPGQRSPRRARLPQLGVSPINGSVHGPRPVRMPFRGQRTLRPTPPSGERRKLLPINGKLSPAQL